MNQDNPSTAEAADDDLTPAPRGRGRAAARKAATENTASDTPPVDVAVRAATREAPAAKPGGLTLVRAGDAEEGDRLLRALVYGMPGAGKTRFATGHEPCVVLELEEQGLDTVEIDNPHALLFGSARRNVATFADLRTLLSAIRDGSDTELQRLDKESRAAGGPGLVVVIDSAFELQNSQIDDVLTTVEGGRTKVKQQMTKKDWGTLSTRQRLLYRWLRSIPYHLVVTSLCDWTQDDERGRQLGPLVKGGLARELGGYFNLVGYAYKRRNAEGVVEHYIITEGSESVQTKPIGKVCGVIRPDLRLLLDVFMEKADPSELVLAGAPTPTIEETPGEARPNGGRKVGGFDEDD